MSASRIASFALAFVALGAAAAPDDSQTVVVPGLPGAGKNQEVRIAGQEISDAEVTGPEVAIDAELVQWEEGRSITVKRPDFGTKVVPVPSNIIFPPDLRPGAAVTILARQTSEGRFRVTGLRMGSSGGAWPQPSPAPAAVPAPPLPAPAAAVPAGNPPAAASAPPVPPARGSKAVAGPNYIAPHGTVKAYEAGKSITFTLKNGKTRTVAIAANAPVPEGLAVGDRVVVRVPLAKPADGKTTDRIEREEEKTDKIPSKFQDAQSPK